MARDYFINGETMVSVNGAQLGLSEGPVVVSLNLHHLDIKVNSFGDVPPECQFMLAEANVRMTLVHVDRGVLDTAIASSMGGASIGQMPRAGTRMSGNYISLSISSPVGSKPWTFPSAFMTQSPMEFPLGAERSLIVCTFRAIPHVADPATAAGAVLWTYS